MANRDLQLVSLPKLFTPEIIIQEEEPDAEGGFTLGEGDLGPVKRGGTEHFGGKVTVLIQG